MNARRLAGILLTVLAGAVVLGVPLWRAGSGAGGAPEQGAPPLADQGDGEKAASRRGAASAPFRPENLAPLPPLDTPLRQVVGELERRAAAGDSSAACRLAAEFERCEQLRFKLGAMQAARGEMRAMVEREPLGAQARDAFAGRMEEYDRMLAGAADEFAHCDGMARTGGAQRARHWRNAALAGHPVALRHYAIGNAFRFNDLLDAVPELAIYRQEAEAMARRAATGGDLAMLHALAMAYLPVEDSGPDLTRMGHRTFLAQTVAPDAEQALALLFALERHPVMRGLPVDHPVREASDRERERLVGRLGPAAIGAASAAADAWTRTWSPTREDPAAMGILVGGALRDVRREQCGPVLMDQGGADG